ncbi:MAG: FAD:protein FMN transferase [Coriobacteriia bacterium]|nr:FAD:protein FMN transferase [Coriobacteriia bacterium]
MTLDRTTPDNDTPDRASECAAYRLVGNPQDDERGIEFFAFDTANRITLQTTSVDNSSECDAILARAFERCAFFEHTFSRTRADSDVSRINRANGTPTQVEPEVADIVRLSLSYSELSHGAFDITIGALTRLWDFHTRRAPSAAEITGALEHVDYRNLLVDETTVQLLDPAAALDLGGIAKGYIADDIATHLRQQGVQSALVDLGGNIFAVGGRGTGDWLIGISDPHDMDRTAVRMRLRNAAVVTSGITERCFTSRRGAFNHLLDRRTGRSIDNDLLSATVIAPSSTTADAVSTICMLLGREGALELAENWNDIEVVLIDRDQIVSCSSGLAKNDDWLILR